MRAAWRLIDDAEPLRGAWNMAVDEALFREAEEGRSPSPVLRLYGWSPACLSIGFHQRIEDTSEEGYCTTAGFDVVRRPTGGKAVLHDDEVTYSVVGRQDLPPFAHLGLVETYGLIAQALAEALRSLGLDVALSERTPAVAPAGGAPCFLVPSEREITVGGRKVVGSAQKRGRRAFLQHGAVPLRLDYPALALASGQPLAHAAMYRTAFAGVADVKPGVTRAALRSALCSGFRKVFEGPWEERPLTEVERESAERLQRERYGNASWTRKVPVGAGLVV